MSDQPATAALRDLLFRADNAAKQLDLLAQKDSNQGDYAVHLVSKVQGVRLVIGYIEGRITVAVTRSTWGLWWVYVVMVDAQNPLTRRFVYGYALTEAEGKAKADKRADRIQKGLVW